MDGTLCISTITGTNFYRLPVARLPVLVAQLMVAPTVDEIEQLLAETAKGVDRSMTLSVDMPTLILQRRRVRTGSVYVMRYVKADNSPLFLETLPMDPARRGVYDELIKSSGVVGTLRTQIQRLQQALLTLGQQALGFAHAAQR